MTTPELGSILLGSADPARLRDWYSAAFGTTPDDLGWLTFGDVDLLADGRSDVGPTAAEPQRHILNFHVTDIDSVAARLDELGARWLVRPEKRDNGVFGTLLDPDGNYLQVLELTLEHRREAQMRRGRQPFSGFSVNDIPAARDFYSRVLGVDVGEQNGMLELRLSQRTAVLVYPKPDHVPAGFTVLNFPTDDIEARVDELAAKGVTFLRYGDSQDDRGIHRDQGPAIAWFTDPAGNILSVLEG